MEENNAATFVVAKHVSESAVQEQQQQRKQNYENNNKHKENKTLEKNQDCYPHHQMHN